MPSPEELFNPISRPRHYLTHPSGVECIQITEHFNFCLGNAIKYIWRAAEKGARLEDLKKARWYIDREIERIERLTPEAHIDTSTLELMEKYRESVSASSTEKR